ncbi:major facilitator superfamily transporter [Pseudomonas sp. M47T1]|uniref:MFS transporter n=1 Tax=unclassified Pseudomonas TaxID=196821 RepID=UPI00026083D8|nr:MFS transporter [Pseudomonas sp. M47T1]EIK93485.1 major facilitator superfamily transporter [Pseudomonas sp. M47T1]
MSQPASSPSPTPAPRRRLVIGLLMAVMVISVLDKTIFAFAGPQIIDELHLSAQEFGFVGSAFFFLYSLSGIGVGFLANRFPTRWILTLMALVWTSAQLLVTFANGLAALTASRLLLGAGCGPGTAVTQHASFKWYTADRQVLPASLLQVSIMLGGLLGAIALPLIIAHFGWRSAYLLLAALSLVWMLAWWLFGADGNQAGMAQGSPALPTTVVPYRHLLLNRTFVWISLMCFLAYLPNALSFSWSAVYLQKGLGLSSVQAGYVLFAATLSIIVINLLLSALSQRLLKRGTSVQRSLVLPPMACCILGGLAFCMLGTLTQGLTMKLVCYVLGGVLLNGVFAFGMTITSHISPLHQRGAMLAIHVGCMTLSGMLAPWAVGRLVMLFNGDIAQGFETALHAIGVAAVLCAALGLYVITPAQTRQHLQARWAN